MEKTDILHVCCVCCIQLIPSYLSTRLKYDVILKTFPGICSVIFENFWRNSMKTVKKFLRIFKKYQKNLKKEKIIFDDFLKNFGITFGKFAYIFNKIFEVL